MYKGKHFIKDKRCLTSWAALALALVLALSAGGTIAYLITNTSAITNTFTPSEVDCEIIEPNWVNETSTAKTNVYVKNTGDTDAHIRATIVATWQNDEGKVLAVTPVLNTDYTLDINESGWTKKGDYYYCVTAGVPNTQTSVLIEKCEVIGKQDGYFLCVDVLAQAIHAEPASAEASTWSSDLGLAVIKPSSN